MASFIVKSTLTAMGKFIALTLLDGSLILYETLTGITWRTEHIDGKHSGVGLVTTNYIMEISKEGSEHRMMNFITKNTDRLQKDFSDARGLGQSTYQEQ